MSRRSRSGKIGQLQTVAPVSCVGEANTSNMRSPETRTGKINRKDVLKALATGPAFALAGCIAAVVTEANSPHASPFSPEFHNEYAGLWLVPGVIGFVIVLVRLASLLRGERRALQD